MTYSSPSLRAVVDTAEESEPNDGSVMAIAAQVLPKLSSCSSVATAARAELPRPWNGSDSVKPTSPQQVSMTLSSDAMLPPFFTPARFFFSSPRPPDAPEKALPPSAMPSIIDARVSSSRGYSCSARSYLREMGRKISAAA